MPYTVCTNRPKLGDTFSDSFELRGQSFCKYFRGYFQTTGKFVTGYQRVFDFSLKVANILQQFARRFLLFSGAFGGEYWTTSGDMFSREFLY